MGGGGGGGGGSPVPREGSLRCTEPMPGVPSAHPTRSSQPEIPNPGLAKPYRGQSSTGGGFPLLAQLEPLFQGSANCGPRAGFVNPVLVATPVGLGLPLCTKAAQTHGPQRLRSSLSALEGQSLPASDFCFEGVCCIVISQSGSARTSRDT